MMAGAASLLVAGPLALALPAPRAWGAEAPASSSSSSTAAGPMVRRPFPARSASSRLRPGSAPSASGWWLGTAGVALALALCGGVSAASRRYLPGRGAGGPLRVIGRASLTAKQAVYLVEVGDRVLIVGAGGQGPPSLLGELTDPEACARAAGPRRPTAADAAAVAVARPTAPGSAAGRFDHRLGDDL